MLQITNLSYRYPASRKAPLCFPAFSLARGENAILFGPSGSGKSTLLHLLAAILPPQDGALLINGLDLASLPRRAADAWRGRHIGFLTRKPMLVASLSVWENLLLPAYASRQAIDIARAEGLLRSLELADQARAMPHQLTPGQKQRAALARALIHRPTLLLADEPTASLDDADCAASLALLASHAAQAGASLIIATHDARVLPALPAAQVMRLPSPAMEMA